MMADAFASIHHNTLLKPLSPKPAKRTMVKNYSNANIPKAARALKRGSSFVVGQKLRESKWFSHSEARVFCAVVENGFIVELKTGEEVVQHGIVLWTTGNEKSKNPDHLQIYTLSEAKGKTKVTAQTLHEFWPPATLLRINNKNDRVESPLEEDIIRNQVYFALNARRKWHNSEHFAYFCRYGPIESSKKISDHLKWNTGSFFQKIKSLSIK